MERKTEFLSIFFFFCIIAVNAHNYLVNPVSRADQRDTQTGCRYGNDAKRSPQCGGPCDRTVSQMTIAPISIQRGANIQLNWYRHTHPGGFIRFAWSPTANSDSKDSFNQHIDHFVCKEVGGCGPSDPSQPTSTTNGANCGATITVPTYLTNGGWTLQWAYFGGWYNAGDYYACVDYTINGGPTGNQQSPYFVGGDVTYPNENVCSFYSTNALGVCTVEPCLNGTFSAGEHKGTVLGFGTQPLTTGIKPITSHSTPVTPITSHSTPVTPITSHSTPVTPITSHSTPVTAITSHSTPVTPITSGKVNPITSGKINTSPTTTAENTQCVVGNMRCVGPDYQMCGSGGVWAAVQTCGTGLQCNQQGNIIYCLLASTSSSSSSSSTTNKPPNPSSSTTSSSSSNNCTGNQARCADETHYQSCFNGVYATPQACQSGLICQAINSRVYCTRPGETIKEINGAYSTTSSYLLWISISLLVNFYITKVYNC